MIELEILPVPSVEMEVSEPNTVEMSLGNATIIGDKDHTHLINRDASDQHPISAITDLQSELDSKIEIAVTAADDGKVATVENGVWTKKDLPESITTWQALQNKPFDTVDVNTMKVENTVLKVYTTDNAEEDNTKPITSSGVHVIVGNIDALLSTI